MQVFAEAAQTLAGAGDNYGLRLFERKEIRELADRALDETEKHGKRTSPLTMLFVLWTVLAMALYRHVSIANVLKKSFGLARKLTGRRVRRSVTPEAFYRARYRLGPEPLKAFFQGTAKAITLAPSYRGLRVWGVDGVRMNIPDTKENEEYFGRPTASRGSTAFPQLMAVALVKTDTRQVRDIVVGGCTDAERPGCVQLLSHLSGGDLLLMDRGLSAVWLFLECQKRGVRFLGRISASWKPRLIRRLGKGDWLVEVHGFVSVQNKKGKTVRRKVPMQMRMIQYKVGPNEVVRLVTDLVDPKEYPARELAVLYHERWECELAYDELKTHLSTVTHGTLDTIFRSKYPKGVVQEAYALLATYNLIRGLMAEAGEVHGVPPLEISFVDTVEVLREALPAFQSASPRRRRALLDELLADIAACRLRPRRQRSQPRKVKQKMSNFGLKRSGDRGEHRDFVAELRLYG